MARTPRSSSPPSQGRPGRRKTEKSTTGQRRAIAEEKRERKDALATLKKFADAADALQRGDSWQNVTTGLGVAGRDWTMNTTIETDPVLTRQQLDDLYAQDNIAARIVDTIPEDGVANWFEIVGVSGEAEATFQQQIFSHLQRLSAKQRFLEWWKFGRKDGGGLLLIGADDGRRLDEPLEMEAVREIRHLHFVERWYVFPDTIDVDPKSDHFGEPLYYMLLPRAVHSTSFASYEAQRAEIKRAMGDDLSNTLIHHSRVIPFRGVKVSERRKLAFLGWSYSNLQRCYWSIQNYRVLWAHIATLFKHMAQTVVKFAGYAELSAGDFQRAINKRLQQLQMARSTLNIVPLDANDSLEEQTFRGLSGVIDILKYAQEDVAQAADMPLTKLFGHLPQGFGKDDVAGRDNWNKRVRGQQEEHVLEPMTDLIRMIAQAYRIKEPEDWAIDFMPIDPPSAAEAAKIDLEEAQADHQRIEDGVLEPEEARDSLRADPKLRYRLKPGPAKHDPVVHPELAQPPPGGPNEPKAAPPGAGGGA